MTGNLTKHTVVAGAIALVALLSACSSSSKTTTAAGTSTTAAPNTTMAPTTTQSPAQSQASVIAALPKVGAATATGKTVSLAKGPQGIFLIGPDGRTLYIFTKDKGTTTACTSAECMQFWPALTATGAITAGPGITLAKVTTPSTSTTAHQVAYYGHLLYYFKGDKTPGQTNGLSIPGWPLLGPFGNVMLPHS
jgi:predicted lipoprotein with Yx(FWY)xxD motif